MESNTGWIKLYRSLLQKAVWKDSTAQQKVVLITILLLASHSEAEWVWKGKRYTCHPGQLKTSLDSLSSVCGKDISTQNVRTALKNFEKLGFITNESTKTGRIITVNNWNEEQGTAAYAHNGSNNSSTKSSQRPNKYLTPINNNKNERIRNTVRNNKNISPLAIEDEWFDTYGGERGMHDDTDRIPFD